MKTRPILFTAVAVSVAALAVGCKPKDNPPPSQTGDTPATYESVKKETKEAAQAANEYAYAQRAEFTAKMKAEIAELNKEMDQLGERIEKSSGAAKEEAKVKLQALRERTAQLDQKLDGVKDATESTWEDVKAGLKKGYEETKVAFNDARQWLSDKIAP